MQSIESEVTGSIWKIEAKVGDLLGKGDIIMIIESMKMEIPVEAPIEGRLESLLVAEGDKVQEGQQLATLNPE